MQPLYVFSCLSILSQAGEKEKQYASRAMNTSLPVKHIEKQNCLIICFGGYLYISFSGEE